MPPDQSTRIATVTTPFGKDDLGLLSLTGTESLSIVPCFELTMIRPPPDGAIAYNPKAFKF